MITVIAIVPKIITKQILATAKKKVERAHKTVIVLSIITV